SMASTGDRFIAYSSADSLVDDDFSGLDDGLHFVTGLELEGFGRTTRDNGHDLDASHGDNHLGHHVGKLHGLDGSGKLISGAQHGGLLNVEGGFSHGLGSSLRDCQAARQVGPSNDVALVGYSRTAGTRATVALGWRQRQAITEAQSSGSSRIAAFT